MAIKKHWSKLEQSTLSKDITTEELMKLDYRYSYSDGELYEDWNRLVRVREYKKGSQFKPGMKLCQYFFPNFWDIKSNKGKSFSDCWNDYELMDKVREWGLKSMSELWMSWIRRAVFMAGGLPNSSFYRPHFSKQIITQKVPNWQEGGTLFDPCCGWGGRMLGTVATGWNYIGCEPNVETYNNLQRLVEFLDIGNKVEIHNTVVEDFQLPKGNKVVLTSPPYFNLEMYTSEKETQSYNKFSEYESWRDNWLAPLIEKSLDSLVEKDGISAWNVMNVGKLDLVTPVIETHSKHGFELIDTLGFQSPLNNIRKLKNKDVTYVFSRK